MEGYDPSGTIETELSGYRLLTEPLLNAGSAFTRPQREEFDLDGLLPANVSTIEQQLTRTYEAYGRKDDDLERHIYLRSLQDRNEVLFYALLERHLTEMMPIVYTPVVGLASQEFSHIYRRPRGLFIGYPDRGRVADAIGRAPVPRVDVIVVTDGGRILGLGDQGAGGMVIPIGKLSLYTACGGIHPGRTLPVLLDAGTDNPRRLDDPLYMGWRHERVKGGAYDELVDAFVEAVIAKSPARTSAMGRLWPGKRRPPARTLSRPALHLQRRYPGHGRHRYRHSARRAMRLSETRLRDQRLAILGAGSAGCGIAAQLVLAMVRQGLAETEARSRLYLIDRQGLLLDDMPGLLPFQRPFARPRADIVGWKLARPDAVSFADAVANARATILIGLSGQPGLFTEAIVREMARHAPRPVILPLSNPTSRAEATPEDLLAWTDGRAIVATGGAFPDVVFRGRTIPIAQCNNSYVFPAMGLGVLASGARRVTDAMFRAAAEALSESSPALGDADEPLLPRLRDIRDVTRHIARVIALQAQRDAVADAISPEELEARLAANFWIPAYPVLRRKRLHP